MSVVEYELEQGVGRIHLNRPERLNAMVPELVDGLCVALARAAADGAAAVILAGRGRSFCAGHDLTQDESRISPAERRRNLERLQDVTRSMRRLPAPVIAAVHGYALGGGCEFALCSDLVVATPDAVFGFPEVSVGLGVTGGISHILPLAVGLARAKEMLLVGERIPARRALELGLINRIVPGDALMEEAGAIARRLRDLPRTAVAMAKRSLDRGCQVDLEAAFELEIEHGMALHASPEAAAAASAFRARSTRASGG